MKGIEVAGLRKSYRFKGKDIEAVKGISFSVKKGEIFGLLGPNGAGKSTTINILAGLLTKDSGDIKILGKDPVREWEYVRNRMNVSSAYFYLSDILTVEQNLRVYGRLFSVREVEPKINELLKSFSIDHMRKKKLNTLSSGEHTRVNLCKALINTPEVLLLDECTVGLDPDMAERTREIIQQYKKDYKPSIIFTSHYMYEVEELCNRIAFLSRGEIVKIDTSKNLKQLITKLRIELALYKIDVKLKKFFSERNIEIKQKGNTVNFVVDSRSDDLYKTLNSLFKRGYKVKNLEIHRPTLNDLFIKIARGEDLK